MQSSLSTLDENDPNRIYIFQKYVTHIFKHLFNELFPKLWRETQRQYRLFNQAIFSLAANQKEIKMVTFNQWNISKMFVLYSQSWVLLHQNYYTFTLVILIMNNYHLHPSFLTNSTTRIIITWWKWMIREWWQCLHILFHWVGHLFKVTTIH